MCIRKIHALNTIYSIRSDNLCLYDVFCNTFLQSHFAPFLSINRLILGYQGYAADVSDYQPD